ncbi:uncharacterized protein LOC129900928 [Solanum dulcamara]|uniref:uncharacterized protein LOC129900928 n=1 Tax=Solanum dulcamara TaxID=45834 RepID=UPI002486953E|nr:uncharacterized protein LOC129900928 [Solanum dulcamara]
MQNLKITIDLLHIKPIKNKSDEKLYHGKEFQEHNSISNLQNDNQSLSRKSLSSTNKLSNVEVYYGNAPLAVPFKWESQPGTPKVKILETPLPPLTPPPSFLEKKMKNAIKKQTKGKLLQRLFFLPKLNLRKSQLQPSPTSSSSSSLSSSSFSSPPRCWSYSVPSSPCRVKSNF